MNITTELRHALRSLVRRPGFTVVAVLTLALGIGANTAIFAVVHAILIRPLPYPDSERIVHLQHQAPGINLRDLENSPGTLRLYIEHARSFDAVAAVQRSSRNLTGGVEPLRVEVAEVTPSFFDVMRVTPLRGRPFTAADAEPGAPPVVLLSHATWRNEFGARPDIIGSTIELDGVTSEVVGVMPAWSTYPHPDVAVLLPHWLDPNGPVGRFGITGLARLAPGVSIEAARSEVARLQERLEELSNGELTQDFMSRAGWSASVETLRDSTVGEDIRSTLWIVLGTVGFLLLVACASVANLFLVRAESRQRESGLRLALGSSRARLAATFLSESVLLGIAGGVVGIVLAYAGVRALVAAGPEQLPRLHEVSVGAPVLLFALAISILAGLLFGLLPLPQQLRSPLQQLVRDGRGSAGRDRQRVRKMLIVAQIALALVLLTGSTLMLRSLQRMQAVDPGVRPDGVLTIGVSMGSHVERAEAALRYQRVLDEMRALPGVAEAGLVNALPLAPDGLNGGSFDIESRPQAEDALPPVSMYSGVSTGYFEAIGTHLVGGRSITREDVEQARDVVWVSERFVRDFLDGADAIGERIRFGANGDWLEIVGVVRDVHTFGVREEPPVMAYMPMTQPIGTMQIGTMTLVLRTNGGDALQLAAPARAAIQRVEPTMPVMTARTMQAVVDDSMADAAFTTTILLVAAVVALLLGAVGLYGVIGYVVSQRTQEIGVRIALGAHPRDVQRMVLREGIVLAALGIVLGAAGAIALTRVIESLLYEVDPLDPLTFIAAPLVLLAVSALAAFLPARRASGVSPLEALKAE